MSDREKQFLRLQPSEAAVSRSACGIYAAHLSAGHVPSGEEDAWMERSVREAIRISHLVDRAVIVFDRFAASYQNWFPNKRCGRSCVTEIGFDIS